MGNIRQPSVLLDAPESGQLINSLRTAFVTHIVPAKCSVSTPSTVQPSRHPVGSSQSLLRQAFSEGSHRAVWSRRYGYTTGTSLTASLFLPSTTNTTGVRTMSSADIVQQQQQQQQQQRQRQQRQPSPSQIPTVFTPLTVQPSARRRLIPTGTTSEHFANTSSKVSSTPPDHQWQVECAPQITITKDQLAGRDPSHAADERIRLELMILDIIEHARRVQSASAQSSDAIRTFEDNIEVRLSADVMEHDDGTGRLLDTLFITPGWHLTTSMLHPSSIESAVN
ncbi:hypothetical protein GQ42DRAFT_158175 [Ramicandelaber brevisporus]|nr:hypothetical protein GQ42DRAFT_158175 [Ramicandelaber brevisporus]